jgi:ADP-heptose:LPS heptosyltransferase
MRLLDEPDGRPELLMLRALKLGDLLVAVPAVHGIRRANPEHRLVLAVPGWLEPIVDMVPGIDALLPTPGLDGPLPLRSGRVDTVVNLHGNGPESRGVLEVLAARRRVGHRSPGWDGPDWQVGIHERERWARLVRAHGMPAEAGDLAIDRPAAPSTAPGCVVVHVGAFYGSRRWPVPRFARVVRFLRAQGERVVLTGSTAERERALQVASLAGAPVDTVLAGVLDLGAFAALIASAALVVSADTGAAHLASAYAIPSVVIFGPAPPEEWGPPENGRHIVLTDARLRRGETFGSEPDPALLAVTVDDVLSGVASLLRSGRP